MSFVDQINVAFYERLFADDGWVHKYPNVNTIRCELWYFRQRQWPGKVLDYGFGSGQEMLYFAQNGYEVYGVEISQTAIDRLNRLVAEQQPEVAARVNTRLLGPSDARLPFDDGFFDFIHANQVICHLPNEVAVRSLVREWHRVLRPGGRLMFSTPGPQNSMIAKGREVEPNWFEWEYEAPNYPRATMRNFCMKDEAAIRDIASPFVVDEVGWFTNHYCGIDGFFWQVLARKAASGPPAEI